MDGKMLAKAFARNHSIVMAQTDGISHEDSMTQSPYNVNCLNWVVGHLVQSRDVVLGFLGAETVLNADEFARYERESDPVVAEGPSVVRLERLLDSLALQQERIDEVLAALSTTELEAPHRWGETDTTLLRRLHFHYFHDTYHTGQTDLLRQISGKNDKVI